jgi:hypothetical protein
MHLRIPGMQLRALLADICLDILCLIKAGQHRIPAKTLFNYEI